MPWGPNIFQQLYMLTPSLRNRGKTPGTPVQHELALGTRGAEFRHFLASDYGTTWDDTKSARGFAPLTPARADVQVNTAKRLHARGGNMLIIDANVHRGSAVLSCSP